MHPILPKVLSKAELCSQLSISQRTIESMVKAREFPPPVRIGKYVYWSEIAVANWHRSRFAQQERWGE